MKKEKTTATTATTATTGVKRETRDFFKLTTATKGAILSGAFPYGEDNEGYQFVFNVYTDGNKITVCKEKDKDSHTFEKPFIRELAVKLEKLERLSGADKKALSVAYDNCLVKLYNILLKQYKEAAKKKAFEESGVKFTFEEKEYRFKPYLAIDGDAKYILFRSVDKNAIIAIHSETINGAEKLIFKAVGKGGRNKEVNDKLVSLTADFLEKDIFKLVLSGTFEELYTLCTKVKDFSSCSFPKVLK